jgi:tRNA G18 (ribose-2'-O)-methylase SpoU
MVKHMQSKAQQIRSANNVFQRIEVLKRNRTKRHQYQEFFVEGVEALKLALAQAWSFRCICFSSARELSSWARNFIEAADPSEIYAVAPELMGELSDKENPSELVAVLRQRKQSLETCPMVSCPLFLLLDRPMNPGNLGSTIRSAAAFGATALFVCGHACDPFDSVTIRSSVGTVFALPVVQLASPLEIEDWIAGQRRIHPDFQIIGTSHNGTLGLTQVDLSRPTLLLLGNEGSGLSAHFLKLSQVLTRIPLSGVTTSLNLSSAASIFLYEAWRQRTQPPANT